MVWDNFSASSNPGIIQIVIKDVINAHAQSLRSSRFHSSLFSRFLNRAYLLPSSHQLTKLDGSDGKSRNQLREPSLKAFTSIAPAPCGIHLHKRTPVTFSNSSIFNCVARSGFARSEERRVG